MCFNMMTGFTPSPQGEGDLLKRQKEYMDAYEKHQQRTEQLVDRDDKLMEHGEQSLAHREENETKFEKIINKWETQQAQYQKYLDSLPTSQSKEAR